MATSIMRMDPFRDFVSLREAMNSLLEDSWVRPVASWQAPTATAFPVDIYQTENKANKSPDAKAKATALAQRVISQYPQSDYASRARTLLYLLQQGIPIYGSNVD